MYNVILKDSQETEAPASQELFGQESDREQTVPVSEKLLKDIRKFINANQFIKHSMFICSFLDQNIFFTYCNHGNVIS